MCLINYNNLNHQIESSIFQFYAILSNGLIKKYLKSIMYDLIFCPSLCVVLAGVFYCFYRGLYLWAYEVSIIEWINSYICIFVKLNSRWMVLKVRLMFCKLSLSKHISQVYIPTYSIGGYFFIQAMKGLTII